MTLFFGRREMFRFKCQKDKIAEYGLYTVQYQEKDLNYFWSFTKAKYGYLLEGENNHKTVISVDKKFLHDNKKERNKRAPVGRRKNHGYVYFTRE
jgi:hypothetical protein